MAHPMEPCLMEVTQHRAKVERRKKPKTPRGMAVGLLLDTTFLKHCTCSICVSSYFTLTCAHSIQASPPLWTIRALLISNSLMLSWNATQSAPTASPQRSSSREPGCFSRCHAEMCTRDLATDGIGCSSMWLAGSACWLQDALCCHNLSFRKGSMRFSRASSMDVSCGLTPFSLSGWRIAFVENQLCWNPPLEMKVLV